MKATLRRRAAGLFAAGLALTVIAGCGAGGSPSTTAGTTSQATTTETSSTSEATTPSTETATTEAGSGGTLRLADPSFYATDAFDPTGEYAYQPWEIMGGMLLRTLVSYRHVSGNAGTEVLPDLAEALPEISADKLTYTFTLRPGVRFGPPVNREITSHDVAYAFERMASGPEGAQYAFYYTVIDGFSVHDGPPAPISGIETPDDRTIVFHLTQPTGDFLARLTLPSTAPIPEEVAKCFPKGGDYGRYVISSGPYMIEGSDQLDIGSCDAMQPLAGADPATRYSFVRNPNYDRATDNPEIRENLIDGLVWTLNTNVQDIYNLIHDGQLDGTSAPPPPKVIAQYAQDSELRDRLKANPANRTWPIALNLTQPPFDDVHVRLALNWLFDKASLRRAGGGEIAFGIATHDLPDFLVRGALADYDPFASPNHAGDLAKAKEEMKQSQYDSNGDGVCDASACKDVLLAVPVYPPATEMEAELTQAFAQIGIGIKIREFNDPYLTFGNVRKNIPAYFGIPLSADYPDPFGFYSVLNSDGISEQGNFNWSLLGLKPEQAPALGITGSTENVPAIDADIAHCEQLDGDERLSCFAEVDKKMTGEIAAWVPLFQDITVTVIGPAVVKFDFDQAQGYMSLAHVALDPSKQ